MEDYRCIHVTKILGNDCKIDSLIMHEFHNCYRRVRNHFKILTLFFLSKSIIQTKLLLLALIHLRSLGLGQTSLFSCAEPNANDLKSLFELISIRFGA